jgi:hypothetical protein
MNLQLDLFAQSTEKIVESLFNTAIKAAIVPDTTGMDIDLQYTWLGNAVEVIYCEWSGEAVDKGKNDLAEQKDVLPSLDKQGSLNGDNEDSAIALLSEQGTSIHQVQELSNKENWRTKLVSI